LTLPSPSANLWDQRYTQDNYAYGRQPNEFLLNQIQQLPKGKVLSLAEGQGRNAIYLAQQGFNVTAVDASAVAMHQTEEFAQLSGVSVTTITTDLAAYLIEANNWDAILSIYCHLPSNLRKAIHRQVVKGLRPGGVFLLESFTPQQIQHQTGGPKNADMLASLSELKEELQGLVFIIAQELERDVQEGLHHTGIAAVVQVLAIKP
jgi:2-polyprenyl-3-methyl-5-hydroxy-6-metoxy-1,4-benzoquinol methylase